MVLKRKRQARQNPSLKSNQISKTTLFLFVMVFAGVGGFLLLHSFAAVNPLLNADLNNDNTVNASDLTILLSAYGTTNTNADVNSDGKVNITDLSILLSKYGATVTPPPPPPPASSGTTRDVTSGQSILAAIDASTGGDTVRIHAGSYPKLTLDKSFTTPVKVVGESGVTIAGVYAPTVAGYDFSAINFSVPNDTNCCDASAFYFNGHSGNISIHGSTLHGGFVTIKFYSGSASSGWPYNITIKDNEISQTGGDLIHIDGASNLLIEHNNIHDPGSAGAEHHDAIQVQASDGLSILRNTISSSSVSPMNGTSGNGQGIIMRSDPANTSRKITNSVIANNLFANWNFGRTVQLLDGIQTAKFVNNTIYGGGGDDLSLTVALGSSTDVGNSGIEIWNNIMDQAYLQGAPGISFYDTNWFRVQANSGASGTNFTVGDPQFLDTTKFALKPASPARNKGLARTGTPSIDIDNTARPSPPELGARL